jgi:hypothetical protein
MNGNVSRLRRHNKGGNKVEPRPTLIEYLTDTAGAESTHPEVARFVEDLLIMLEHEYFAEEELIEDTAWDNQ